MLEGVLVDERVGLPGAQQGQLPRPDLEALLDEVEVGQRADWRSAAAPSRCSCVAFFGIGLRSCQSASTVIGASGGARRC